jgi:hypothetical protein
MHVQGAQEAQDFVHSIVGVTYEQEGKTTKELSGKAIGQLQAQGQTTGGVYFDNYFYGFQTVGQIALANIEQFFDREMEIRVTGDVRKDEFVEINKRTADGKIKNAINRDKADFIVSKQDWRETIRLAGLQMLAQVITDLAKAGMGQETFKLLDEVVDMMDDLPNKDEIVRRIREMNGQHGPEDEMTPEEKQAFQESQTRARQEQEALKVLQFALAQAQLAIKQAEATNKQTQAMKNQTEAIYNKLEAFLKALETSREVALTPQLAAAADELIREAERAPRGGNGNNGGGRIPPSRQIGGQ